MGSDGLLHMFRQIFTGCNFFLCGCLRQAWMWRDDLTGMG